MNINICSDIIIDEGKNECIAYLSEKLDRMYKYFDIPVNIVVNVIDYIKSVGEEDKVYAGVYYDNEIYYIEVIKDVFEEYEKKRYCLIEGILYHEFLHIYDLYNVLQCCDIKIEDDTISKIKDFITNIGYHFWTEFYAHYRMFHVYKNYFPSDTRLQMVHMVEELLKRNEEIYSLDISKNVEVINDYCDNVENFVYYLARHMAGFAVGRNRYYKYCEQTQNKKTFKYLYHVVDELYDLIIEVDNYMGNKKMKKNFYRLGNYIYKNIYMILDVEIVKFEGKFYLGFRLD